MECHRSLGFGFQHTFLEISGNPEDFDYPVQVCLIRLEANLVRRWPSSIKIRHPWYSLSTELIGVLKGRINCMILCC